MKSKNVKVIDEHNIDRDANIMFALELEGSEYVVYWIARDEESNNVFVSKVLKNLDGTYNMLNIDDEEKKKEIAEIVKTLISNSVSDQNDKMLGTTTTLSNGKVAKFVNVSFNKEQQISVAKTYITTVKKEVTKVSENYYDVAVEEAKVETVLTAAPVVDPVQNVFPDLGTPAVEASVSPQPAPAVVESIQPTVIPTPVESPVVAAPVEAASIVQPEVVTPVVEVPTPVATPQVVPPVAVEPTPIVQPVAVPPVEAPVSVETPVVEPAKVEPAVVIPTPVEVAPVAQPEVVTPVVEVPTPVAAPQVVPPVAEPATVVEAAPQPLVFNATKETNLNAALGEVANSTAIPVENIEPVREFGVEAPAAQPAPVQPSVAPMVQPEVASDPKILTKKAGFANSKFFMVVAIAFFLASCVFLGYEAYNYFQLVK